jgi:hypothetical protein
MPVVAERAQAETDGVLISARMVALTGAPIRSHELILC